MFSLIKNKVPTDVTENEHLNSDQLYSNCVEVGQKACLPKRQCDSLMRTVHYVIYNAKKRKRCL